MKQGDRPKFNYLQSITPGMSPINVSTLQHLINKTCLITISTENITGVYFKDEEGYEIFGRVYILCTICGSLVLH